MMGYSIICGDKIAFETKPGSSYMVEHIKPFVSVSPPRNLDVSLPEIMLTWQGEKEVTYNVYRAIGSEPGYTKTAHGLTDSMYQHRLTLKHMTVCIQGHSM